MPLRLAVFSDFSLQLLAHDHPVMRQPAAPFFRAKVNIEPVSFTGFPCFLNA